MASAVTVTPFELAPAPTGRPTLSTISVGVGAPVNAASTASAMVMSAPEAYAAPPRTASTPTAAAAAATACHRRLPPARARTGVRSLACLVAEAAGAWDAPCAATRLRAMRSFAASENLIPSIAFL